MKTFTVVIKAKVRLSEQMCSRCESLCVWCSADLIHELYGESVRIVDRRVVRVKGDSNVLALSSSNAALYWHHTEHTQSTVILGSCTGYTRQRILLHLQLLLKQTLSLFY